MIFFANVGKFIDVPKCQNLYFTNIFLPQLTCKHLRYLLNGNVKYTCGNGIMLNNEAVYIPSVSVSHVSFYER